MEGIIKKVAVCMCVMALSFGFAGVNCSFGTLSIAEAGQSYFPETEMYQKTIQKLQGHWVDKNGNVLDFNGNYLNGCYIIKIGEMAGGGSNFGGPFYIQEKEGVRRLIIGANLHVEAGKSTFDDGGNEPLLRYNNSYYHRR